MSRHAMRIFVPATMDDLAVLHRDGSLTADSGFALTDRYRAAVGAEVADDDDVLDYDLLMAAAAVSLDRQREGHGNDPGSGTGDGGQRRVVLAVDLPGQPDTTDPASGRVVIDGPITLPDVASIHVDDRLSTDPEGDLSWYAPQEIVDLL